MDTTHHPNKQLFVAEEQLLECIFTLEQRNFETHIKHKQSLFWRQCNAKMDIEEDEDWRKDRSLDEEPEINLSGSIDVNKPTPLSSSLSLPGETSTKTNAAMSKEHATTPGLSINGGSLSIEQDPFSRGEYNDLEKVN